MNSLSSIWRSPAPESPKIPSGSGGAPFFRHDRSSYTSLCHVAHPDSLRVPVPPSRHRHPNAGTRLSIPGVVS